MKEEMRQKRLNSGVQTVSRAEKAQDFYNDRKSENQQEQESFRKSASRGRIRKGSVYNQRPAGLHKQKIASLM
jgi:hypothetical protein